MRKTTLIAPVLAALLLGGCSALPFGHKDKSRTGAEASQAIKPGLKVAVDVVMARLRSADDTDLLAVQNAAPEIYQLAAALMPPAMRTTVSAQASFQPTPGQPHTLGDLQRMGKRPGAVGDTLGGARVYNASYGQRDVAPPPKLAQARSLMHAVHLGSYRSAQRAMQGYVEIKSKAPNVLAALNPRVERVDLGPEKGIYERLKAGPFTSRAEAQKACIGLRAVGVYCAPADYTGRTPG